MENSIPFDIEKFDKGVYMPIYLDGTSPKNVTVDRDEYVYSEDEEGINWHHYSDGTLMGMAESAPKQLRLLPPSHIADTGKMGFEEFKKTKEYDMLTDMFLIGQYSLTQTLQAAYEAGQKNK